MNEKPPHDPEAQPRFDDDPPPQRKAERKAQPPAKPRRGGFQRAMSRAPDVSDEQKAVNRAGAARALAILNREKR